MVRDDLKPFPPLISSSSWFQSLADFSPSYTTRLESWWVEPQTAGWRFEARTAGWRGPNKFAHLVTFQPTIQSFFSQLVLPCDFINLSVSSFAEIHFLSLHWTQKIQNLPLLKREKFGELCRFSCWGKRNKYIETIWMHLLNCTFQFGLFLYLEVWNIFMDNLGGFFFWGQTTINWEAILGKGNKFGDNLGGELLVRDLRQDFGGNQDWRKQSKETLAVLTWMFSG